jgi:hypothetical protein
MIGAIEAAVLVLGVLVGVIANYWAWSWILAVRRRTRVRRLAGPEGSPPDDSEIHQQSEEIEVDSSR